MDLGQVLLLQLAGLRSDLEFWTMHVMGSSSAAEQELKQELIFYCTTEFGGESADEAAVVIYFPALFHFDVDI